VPAPSSDRYGLEAGSGRGRPLLAIRGRETCATCHRGSGRLTGVDGVSQTAIFAAQVRAAHAVLDKDPIFEDPYAVVLADASEGDIRDLFALIPTACARVARVLPNQRARFVDEEVESAVRRGVGQYVILGAGLDSFAWRRPDLMTEIELFEVDRPSTQGWKQQRMSMADLTHPANLHFVGLEFSVSEGLSIEMTEADFDPQRPSIWSWMGVIVYLHAEVVESTLRHIAHLAVPGSRLLASYTVTPDLMDSDSREFDLLARSASAEGGEDHITVFAPKEIEAMARNSGWRTAASVNPASFAPWFSNRTDGLTPASYERILVVDK
jgi:methyltransferase (TIGR00027 family)